MLALCALACTAGAQTIYKWVMPDGSIRYSDRPQEDGAVERQEITIVTSRPEAEAEASPSASNPDPDGDEDVEEGRAPDTFAGYSSFEITSPAQDQAVRDNGGNVTIQLALEPSLEESHVIELFMNRTSLGTGRTTTITMTNVDRGTHTVQASIRDESGARVATTGAVTFDLLRAAAGG